MDIAVRIARAAHGDLPALTKVVVTHGGWPPWESR
jgi:hypothetical protein